MTKPKKKKKTESVFAELPGALRCYAPALKALKKILLQYEERKDLQCSVYCFGKTKMSLRISEISWTCCTDKSISGSSLMRCEPASGNLLMACEDFLLSWFDKPWRPAGWTTDIDEHADATWKLEQVLKLK